MPTLSSPPNTAPISGQDGKASHHFQQWFTALRRTVAPSDWFYIPTIEGAPTATPEARTGFVPMVYDITNDHLYIYNGSWKKTTVFT